jgi:hypothetical protein
VDGTMRGLGVHALAKKPEVLHFLTNETSRHGDLLATHHDDVLAVEQLLCDEGGKAPKHVVPRIHHDTLLTETRSRHHCCELRLSRSLSIWEKMRRGITIRGEARRRLGFLERVNGSRSGDPRNSIGYILIQVRRPNTYVVGFGP